jgi:hypothetical protein
MNKTSVPDHDVEDIGPKHYVLAAGTGYFKLTRNDVQFSKVHFSNIQFDKPRASSRTNWTQSVDYETNKALNRLLGILLLGFLWRITSSSRQFDPPKSAEMFFCLFLKTGDQDAVVGDFIERYREFRKRRGKVRADLYAYGELLRSCYPLIKRALENFRLTLFLGKWIRKFQS